MPSTPLTLRTDLPCARCSYNLRGLPPTSRCPECGHPIDLTLDADPPIHPLIVAPPTYVQSLSYALVLMLAALAITAATPAIVLYSHPGSPPPAQAYARPLPFTTDLFARALICCAVLLLTRREPDGPHPHPPHPTAAAVVLCLAGVTSFLAPLVTALAPNNLPDYLAFPLMMTTLLALLATAPYYWILASVAVRLPVRGDLDTRFRLLIVLAPAMLFVAGHLRGGDPRFSLFPLLTFGYPADDVAPLCNVHGLLPRLRASPLPLLPPLFLLWTAWLHVRLWRALRPLAAAASHSRA